MKLKQYLTAQLRLLISIPIISINIFSAVAENVRVDASTLTRKVMCGYQGWFRTPHDNQGLNWFHYSHPKGGFIPGSVGIEYWPDMSELSANERFATPFHHADGRSAQVFSSAVRETVVRHFQWMEQYGIDGVFVQRFATNVVSPTGRADTNLSRSVNTVLENCRVGAEKHGRTYAVMYDLSGIKAGQIAAIKQDWRYLVTEKAILKDRSYQQHNRRPVIALWGVGFHSRDYSPQEILDLIAFLKNDPECGGLTVMLGTSTYWRDGNRDAAPYSEWEKVYQLADIISPWTVARYQQPAQAREYALGTAKDDHAWCDQNGKEFMPVVFPGFAWSNLKKGTQENSHIFIDRKEGKFLWSQYDAHVREGGVSMVYQAMFDELDEGTQIFKVTNDTPVGECKFLSYGNLPTDHYLWLVGEATKCLRGEKPFTAEIPLRSR